MSEEGSSLEQSTSPVITNRLETAKIVGQETAKGALNIASALSGYEAWKKNEFDQHGEKQPKWERAILAVSSTIFPSTSGMFAYTNDWEKRDVNDYYDSVDKKSWSLTGAGFGADAAFLLGTIAYQFTTADYHNWQNPLVDHWQLEHVAAARIVYNTVAQTAWRVPAIAASIKERLSRQTGKPALQEVAVE